MREQPCLAAQWTASSREGVTLIVRVVERALRQTRCDTIATQLSLLPTQAMQGEWMWGNQEIVISETPEFAHLSTPDVVDIPKGCKYFD